MLRVACLAAAAAALAGCATTSPPPEARPTQAQALEPARDTLGAPAAESESDLPDTSDEAPAARDEEPARADAGAGPGARLAARARTFVGSRGPFHVSGERFNGDCSGLVAAVYAAEGLDLRGAMQRAAPLERRGARAAWLAARARGGTFGAEATPAPGDLVFWHDTYDQNRNRKADDRLTHVGIVDRVEGAAVHFIHRGGKGVARGVMTLARRHEATDADGRRLNSTLRARSHPVRRGGLAGELFAGFGRLEGPPPDAEVPRPSARARKAAPAKPASTRAAAARRG